MTCQHCGAALPPIAMFCGECGRSVTAAPSPAIQRPVLPSSTPAAMPWSADAPLSISPASPTAPPGFDWSAVPEDGATDESPSLSGLASPAHSQSDDGIAASCEQCGTISEPGDAYCAECGSALLTETRVIERLPEVELEAESTPEPEKLREPEPELAPAPEPEPESVPVQEPAVVPAREPLPAWAAEQPPEPQVFATTFDDVENTRIVPRGTGGARFVLQFSTGESYTVVGSGLAGRNPRPEPSEVVDHLVTIVDPGRSVSKTHLEFGQEAGVFWVSDRHSGNGSVIREPGAAPRPCEPGRRYPVVRGTRIDLGEQFVIVS